MAKRTPTTKVMIPERMSQEMRIILDRINQNFTLLDSKIEKLWKEIDKIENPDEEEE